MFFLVSLGQWHYEWTPFLITNLQNGFMFSFSPCEHRKTSHQFCEVYFFCFFDDHGFYKRRRGARFFPLILSCKGPWVRLLGPGGSGAKIGCPKDFGGTDQGGPIDSLDRRDLFFGTPVDSHESWGFCERFFR